MPDAGVLGPGRAGDLGDGGNGNLRHKTVAAEVWLVLPDSTDVWDDFAVAIEKPEPVDAPKLHGPPVGTDRTASSTL